MKAEEETIGVPVLEVFTPEKFAEFKKALARAEEVSKLRGGDSNASFVELTSDIRHFLTKELGGHGKYDWIWKANYPQELPFGQLPAKIKAFLELKLEVVGLQKKRIDEQKEDIRQLVGFVDFLAEKNLVVESLQRRVLELEAEVERLSSKAFSPRDALKILSENIKVIADYKKMEAEYKLNELFVGAAMQEPPRKYKPSPMIQKQLPKSKDIEEE